MKKLILSTYIILYVVSVHAQIPDWYENMEKYWYYRYRLVNDFMLIEEDGDQDSGPGMSIPASRRTRHNPSWGNDLDNPPPGHHWGEHYGPHLSWGDATEHLGHYMTMLGVERKMLSDNGWNTDRTEYEIYRAVEAFDRLDRDAEKYYSDIDNAFPYNANNIVWNNSLNGFFCRDDVPVNNDLNLDNTFNVDHNYLDFISNNADHFDRKMRDGSSALQNTPHPGYVYTSTFKYMTPEYNALQSNLGKWPVGYTPRVQGEESQDQAADIAVGLGTIIKTLPANIWVHNENVQYKAADAMYRLISWIPKPPSNHAEDHVNYLYYNPTVITWLIKNPVTDHCVIAGHACQYNTAPYFYNIPVGTPNCTAGNHYFEPGSCWTGGAVTWQSAPAQAEALHNTASQCCNYPYFTIQQSASQFQALFQLTQDLAFLDPKDVQFCDDYVVFAHNWYRPLLTPTRNSYEGVRRHAYEHRLQTPHLPMLFKLINDKWGGNYSYCPECHNLTSIRDLLNMAPKCGPYCYQDYESDDYHTQHAYFAGGDCTSTNNSWDPNSPDWEKQVNGNDDWSGEDRVTAEFHRASRLSKNEVPGDADFNGIDYMEIFVLYAMQKDNGGYVQWIQPLLV